MLGTGTLPDAFLAMLLCTCDRWGRVTAKLIAEIDGSGILTDADLDELAESLLGEEVVIDDEYPFLWACPQVMDLGSSEEGEPRFVVDEHTMAKTRRRPEPPLRRWAAARALRHDPGRLDDLLASSGALCHRLLGKLARKRPSPPVRGERRVWAAAVLYAVGSVNGKQHHYVPDIRGCLSLLLWPGAPSPPPEDAGLVSRASQLAVPFNVTITTRQRGPPEGPTPA